MESDRRGFWTGGRGERARVLEEEMAAELAALQSELDRATAPTDVERLETAMRAVRARYARKAREGDDYLY